MSATESRSFCRQPSIIQFVGFCSPFSLFHFLPFFSHLLTQPLHRGLREKQKEMETQFIPTVLVVSLENE